MRTAAAAFAGRYPGATVYSKGRKDAGVMLAVGPSRLVLKIVGAAASENLVALLKQMRDAGHLASDEFSALIDLTEFTGAIDWDEIKKISDVMPKGASRTNKNAYVVHDSFLAMIAKITAVMFPNTTCAAFTTEAEARRWLGWN